EEIEAQYAEWVEAHVGSSPAAEPDSDKTPFSFAAVSEHLKRSRSALAELVHSRKKEDDLSEALTRATALLVDIENDFASGAVLDTRKLEDSLTGLERMLNDAMFSVVDKDGFDELQKEVKDQLKPYRTQMEAAAYKQTFDNLLLKRLREHFAVPRLSLFYV
ncbi:MAG TPA: hypothetical protein VFI71_05510, partial [Pyrinomonadaceae bacterium]|nr:hypothetical protein [Pyrinomonadaceae bacterium]